MPPPQQQQPPINNTTTVQELVQQQGRRPIMFVMPIHVEVFTLTLSYIISLIKQFICLQYG